MIFAAVSISCPEFLQPSRTIHMRKTPKMKILLAAIGALVFLILAGFIYVAVIDIQVPQKMITKEIPHERFNGAP